MVRINQMNPSPEVQLFAKLEWFNPFGSVKDRAAWEMLLDLEKRGEVGAGRGVVEPTSGNTGISLAAMARARGYHMRAVVPNKVPLEKKLLLKIAGAELDVLNDELCPAPGLGDGSTNMAKTHAKAQSKRYVMPNQYENWANAEAHVRTTGITPTRNRQTATNAAAASTASRRRRCPSATSACRATNTPRPAITPTTAIVMPLSVLLKAPVVRIRSISGAPVMMNTKLGTNVASVATVAPATPQARVPSAW